MTRILYHLGRFCSRHHWPVIAVWLVIAIALAVGGRAAGDQTSDDLTLPGTGSTNATNLLEQKLPKQAYGANPLVIKAPKGKLTDASQQRAVDARSTPCARSTASRAPSARPATRGRGSSPRTRPSATSR